MQKWISGPFPSLIRFALGGSIVAPLHNRTLCVWGPSTVQDCSSRSPSAQLVRGYHHRTWCAAVEGVSSSQSRAPKRQDRSRTSSKTSETAMSAVSPATTSAPSATTGEHLVRIPTSRLPRTVDTRKYGAPNGAPSAFQRMVFLGTSSAMPIGGLRNTRYGMVDVM